LKPGVMEAHPFVRGEILKASIAVQDSGVTMGD
jgi:hypothetical protein